MRNPFSRTAQVEATKEETDLTQEIPLGWKVPIEFTRIKKKAGDAGEGKKVVIQRMSVTWKGLNKTFVQRGKGLYFIDPAQLQWQPATGKRRGYWKIQFDVTWCEPLGKDGKAHCNPIVSLILRDESMMQLIQIAQSFLPLQITKAMLIILVICGVMSYLIGLGFNEVFHTAPTTTVHWFTQPPKIVGK